MGFCFQTFFYSCTPKQRLRAPDDFMTVASCTGLSLDALHRPSRPRHSEMNSCFFPSMLKHKQFLRDPPSFPSIIPFNHPDQMVSETSTPTSGEWPRGIPPPKELVTHLFLPLHPHCHCLDSDSHRSSLRPL